MYWLHFFIKKNIAKNTPPPPSHTHTHTHTHTERNRNLAANILKKTFGPIFEPPYLKAAVRSHGFFSKI